MIAEPIKKDGADDYYPDIIAQSKNGSGKTGAFSIGSSLRVDPTIQKPQIICIAHVRELSSQIAAVYEKVNKFTDVRVKDFTADNKWHGEQIVVTTLGKLANNLGGRRGQLDLSELRCFVIDECDVFFSEQRNLSQLKEVYSKYIQKLPKNKVQNIYFSATFTDEVKETISGFTTEANQIELRKEAL